MKTAFISGHTDISEKEFLLHYKDELDKAIGSKDSFVTAAAFGADILAFNYLLNNKVDPSRITVYLHDKYKSRQGSYESIGIQVRTGFCKHSDRDTQMTIDSDYDITWLRPDEEACALYGETWKKDGQSATELNLERRKKLEEVH